MIKEKIVIIGGGGHAKVVASILKQLPAFEVLGYTDREDRGSLLGLPYLGEDGELLRIKAHTPHCAAVLGVGTLGDTALVERLYAQAQELGFFLPTIISPAAVVAEDVKIGQGTVIMSGVVINAGTRIGRGAIINTNSSLDHDCAIGDFTHIAPGVTLSGGVKVGSRCLVGTGASIIHYKTVGDQCIIGAGAVVVKDCLESGTYVGIPAKLLV